MESVPKVVKTGQFAFHLFQMYVHTYVCASTKYAYVCMYICMYVYLLYCADICMHTYVT